MSETGSEYIRAVLPDALMSDLGADVADFLADWYGGMHNFVHTTNIKKVNWSNDFVISVLFNRGMETYDNDLLTKLVVMSHDRLLRVEINPRTFRHLELVFHRRKREKSISRGMPTMEEHIANIRSRTTKRSGFAWRLRL
jgi:hypothetical protein